MRIQHNIPAMNSYRNYANNTSAVSKNLEKLSSGYRINRAGDDAAGLAISEKMRIQITGLEQAQSNAKSGINLIQTAEGALTEVHDMLKRMYTLAEQSANGTYDNEVDRAQLQKELNSLRNEVDRIADSTNYNGINLLDGSMEKKTVTAAVQGVTVAPVKDGRKGLESQAGVFSVDFTNTTLTSTKDDQEGTFKIFGFTVTLDKLDKGQSISDVDLAKQIAAKWNEIDTASKMEDKYGTGLTASVEGSKVVFTMDQAPTKEWAIDSAATISKLESNQGEEVQVTTETEPVSTDKGRLYAQGQFTLTEDMVGNGKTLTIGKDTYVFAVGAESRYKDAANVIDLTDMSQDDIATKLGTVAMRLTKAAIDNDMFKVSAGTVTGADNNTIYLTEREGKVDYAINDLQKTLDNTTDADWKGLVKTGLVDNEKSTSGLTLQIGDTAESFNKLNISVKDMHAAGMGISKIDISTQEGAADALAKIKNATNYVSDVRGDLGALQNRLDHTINSLSVAQENIQDAESNIRDVDIAKEMMQYTKNNILVQSAQAMLAQANQLPQGVLQLLQ